MPAEVGGTPVVTRDASGLTQLLREQNFDLRVLDLKGFRGWLAHRMLRWEKDPVFVQRARIRDLRRSRPDLLALEAEYGRTVVLEAATPQSCRLREVENERQGADKAIAGLAEAELRAAPERLAALRQKRQHFEDRRRGLDNERARLIEASPLRQDLSRLEAELCRLRAELGLDREKARLDELQHEQGRGTGRAGQSFERLAVDLTARHIVPELLQQEGGRADGVRVLTKVKLGAAGVEFDHLVVRLSGSDPVEVLAAVEVKRNVNDLAHGFRRRQADLAWLTGEAGRYDPAAYRTARFPLGHFDRTAVHEEEAEVFVFGPGSFRRFRRDPAADALLDRLYLVTRAGPLLGVSTAARARISHRVATDVHWDPDSNEYLLGLLTWCRSLTEPLEAPDVLGLFAGTPDLERQVLVVHS